MLTGGKLADRYGRRLIFVDRPRDLHARRRSPAGSPTAPDFLIAARVVQGVGAALMNPATLSIITATFPPRQRGTAIGIWAGVSALALAIGPLVGGLITEHISWNWIFFINVPVGIGDRRGVRCSSTSRATPRTSSGSTSPGSLTSGVGLFALTYALIEANNYGWTSPRILASFVFAAVALVAFVLLERHQRLPMLDLSLFRNRTFAGANTAMLLVGARDVRRLLLHLALHAERPRLLAGPGRRDFLPMTVLIILVAPQAGRLADRFGARWLVGGGLRPRLGLAAPLLAARTRLDLLDAPAGDAHRRLRDGG